jgi:metacaspase-1
MSQLNGALAILIGVGDYIDPRFANLPSTMRDAKAIANILTDSSYCGYLPGNVKVIVGQDATACNIRDALHNLCTSASDQSTVLIFFSGHGGLAFENDSWHTYLCPREANPDNLSNTAIPGDEFSDILTSISSKKLLVLLDACHSAGSAVFKASNTWKAGLSPEYYEALSSGSGRVVIASSKSEEYSYVRNDGVLSIFTWHLCEAFKGKAAMRCDGLIHILDVFHYVNEAVHAEQPMQTPILKVKDMDFDFPIALDKGSREVDSLKANYDIREIRESIVRDPIIGAVRLSKYLSMYPKLVSKQAEVESERYQLEQIKLDPDLFGSDPSRQDAKGRSVYHLLRVCLETEQDPMIGSKPELDINDFLKEYLNEDFKILTLFSPLVNIRQNHPRYNKLKEEYYGETANRIQEKLNTSLRNYRINPEKQIVLRIDIDEKLTKCIFERNGRKVILSKPLLLWECPCKVTNIYKNKSYPCRIHSDPNGDFISEAFGKPFNIIKYGEVSVLWTDEKYIWPPSIDTLFMASVLIEKNYTNKLIHSIYDMGCGTGFLGIFLAKNNRNINQVYFSDEFSSPPSLSKLNWMLNFESDERRFFTKFLISDGFERFINEEPAATQLDLVICNPPFLPTLGFEKDLYSETAISGTRLLELVINGSKTCAKELVIGCGSTAQPELENSIEKADAKCELLNERDTPFRMPDAFKHKKYMEELIKQERVFVKDDAPFRLWFKTKILRITY